MEGFSLTNFNEIGYLKNTIHMKKRQKVATKYNIFYKQKKIIECVGKHPEGITPKEIAVETRIKSSTIRTILNRGVEGIEKRNFRGVYYPVVNNTHRLLSEMTLQNARISCDVPNYFGKKVEETLGDREIVCFSFNMGNDSGKANLDLTANYPINLGSISFICTFFKTLISKYSGINVDDKQITISTIEFQKDFNKLRLDGPNCISLTNLISQMKIYNKEELNALRVEQKITVPIPAKVILKLLLQEIKSVDVLNEVCNTNKRLIKLEHKFDSLFRFIERLVEKKEGWM